MTEPDCVMLDAFASGQFGTSYRFHGLLAKVRADTPAEVIPALRQIEAAVAQGHHAAGFIAYEAAAGLNPALATKPLPRSPLLLFGIFRDRIATTGTRLPEPSRVGSYAIGEWRNSLGKSAYEAGVQRIRSYIAAGDTYQVNYTFRRRCRFSGDPLAFYHDLCRAQQAPFCAYLAFGRTRILSASPELFFSLASGQLLVRPMKGTTRRGRWPAEDLALAEALRQNPKERAENLMIVDLLRNDLGMVATTGSVRVESLFDVATLPTVHQMTSTIRAELRPGLGFTELLQALFPCGSVTGAPKRRTMELIKELENGPRGVYTGCIGFLSPGIEAVFSVAIRTVVLDLATGRGTLGIGSGITHDSVPSAEHAECLAKGRFATLGLPDFRLVETILVDVSGCFLLERHLDRLSASAAHFGFVMDPDLVRNQLQDESGRLTGRHKLRLLLSRDGMVEIESSPLELPATPDDRPEPVALARKRVDSADPFLYHKTTHRPLYRAELALRPDCADVIFCNERGEVTEGAMHNIVALKDGRLVTPPLTSGLLAGTFRAELLNAGKVAEGILTPADLRHAQELYLVNSVRGWRRVVLLQGGAGRKSQTGADHAPAVLEPLHLK